MPNVRFSVSNGLSIRYERRCRGGETADRKFSDNIVAVAAVTDFRCKSMKMGGIALAVVGGVGRWLSAESAPNGEGGRCGRAKKQKVFFRRLAEGGTLFEIGTGAEVGVGGVSSAVAAEDWVSRGGGRGLACEGRAFVGWRRTKTGECRAAAKSVAKIFGGARGGGTRFDAVA